MMSQSKLLVAALALVVGTCTTYASIRTFVPHPVVRPSLAHFNARVHVSGDSGCGKKNADRTLFLFVRFDPTEWRGRVGTYHVPLNRTDTKAGVRFVQYTRTLKLETTENPVVADWRSISGDLIVTVHSPRDNNGVYNTTIQAENLVLERAGSVERVELKSFAFENLALRQPTGYGCGRTWSNTDEK